MPKSYSFVNAFHIHLNPFVLEIICIFAIRLSVVESWFENVFDMSLMSSENKCEITLLLQSSLFITPVLVSNDL